MKHASPPAAAFAGMVDLAGSDAGGTAVACSDDFFAAMNHIVRSAAPVFDPQAFTDRGRLMDGWKGRRNRGPGHDWCIVRLGVPGRVRGVDIDTAHFDGDHPPFASIEAAHVPVDTDVDALRTTVEWTPIVAPYALQPGCQNIHAAQTIGVWTHVRIRVYPDGGVARLRVWGEPVPVLEAGAEIDLACAQHGGHAVACSTTAMGSMHHLVKRQPAVDIQDGWETRRRRGSGDDWVIIRLGVPGRVSELVLDTKHCVGSAPARLAVEAIHWPDPPLPALTTTNQWSEIVPSFAAQPDAAHLKTVDASGPWSHIRVRLSPDGGLSRVRVYGVVETDAVTDAALEWVNALEPAAAHRYFADCGGSPRWAARMTAARPFASRAHQRGMAEWSWWQLDEADWAHALASVGGPQPGEGAIDSVREAAAEHLQGVLDRLSKPAAG